LGEMIEEWTKKKSLISFAQENKDIVAVMNRQDPSGKFIQIYDLRRGCFVRKLEHESADDEAFAIDSTARILACAFKDEVLIRLIRLP